MPNIANSRSATHRGWHYDQVNKRLAVEYDGTEVFDFDANDLAVALATTFALGITVTAGSVTMPAGTVSRATLTQDALAVYGVPLYTLRQADEVAMGITGTAGDHFVQRTTEVWSIVGNTPSSSTVTDVSIFQFILPAEYDDGETITLRIGCKVDTTADTNTIDIEVFLANATTGAVGSDICATSVITVTGTAGLKSFTITPSGLVAGDRLNVVMTTVNNDADGTDGIVSIFSIDFLLDVKG